MFVGNMVTEAIPARVFALYKIVENKKSIPRNELQALMEPPEIYEGTSYFSVIFKTATELKLVENKDGIISLVDSNKQLKNIDEFRKHVITVLPEFEEKTIAKLKPLIVGNPMDKKTDIGTLVRCVVVAVAFDRIGRCRREAAEEGDTGSLQLSTVEQHGPVGMHLEVGGLPGKDIAEGCTDVFAIRELGDGNRWIAGLDK